jgi:hypothetical protein
MADRPGDVSMIAAAFLAASVASSTAMPHCAAESAGASLTPEHGIGEGQMTLVSANSICAILDNLFTYPFLTVSGHAHHLLEQVAQHQHHLVVCDCNVVEG